jgi:hypothetical protein
MLDVCKYIYPGLQDFQIAGAVKITKLTGDPNSAVVKPVFITGVIYRIGK